MAYELPPELAACRYLPLLKQTQTVFKDNFDDPFDPGQTYLYRAPGTTIDNETNVTYGTASIYVPDDYPVCKSPMGVTYYGPTGSELAPGSPDEYLSKHCPVKYAVWSVGPNIGSPKFSAGITNAPVPMSFWCMGCTDTGVITHIISVHGADVISP